MRSGKSDLTHEGESGSSTNSLDALDRELLALQSDGDDDDSQAQVESGAIVRELNSLLLPFV